MADAIEDDGLDQDLPIGEIEVPNGDLAEVETPEGEEAEDDILISLEGEGDAPPLSEERDSSVIRELRARNREQARELEALRRQSTPQPQKIEVGDKPTLAGCDFEEDRFEAEYEAWTTRKAEAEKQEVEAQKSQAVQQEAWNRRLAAMEAQKAELPVKAYEQALKEVTSTFNLEQQAVIVRATKNPARMVLALGRLPEKAAELAKIADPIDLTAELARLEGKLTVTTQRKAPEPEQIVRGSAPLSRGADKHLERLEADAAKTGDRTKVVAYKREQRAKARA